MLGAVISLVLFFVSTGDVPRFVHPGAAAQELQLADGWQLTSARNVAATGSQLSRAGFAGTGWHSVRHMPATVLAALEDDGTYPDLYFGDNLLKKVPQDLYKQDWWYRTTFVAPSGHSTYRLDFPGINYRAEIWLNGRRVADNTQIAGMYVDHDVDVSQWIDRGRPNTLAVKVTPERALQDIDGVELADSWFDWINWNYLGYQGPGKNPTNGNSFVPDRNAGIFKPVTLKMSGEVAVQDAAVNTELPLPRTDSARLTVHTTVHNYSESRLGGAVYVRISRPGKPDIDIDQSVTLAPGETRDVTFNPQNYGDLRIGHPDLWWPYTMGRPDLYDLDVDFRQFGRTTDTLHQRFGIRTVQQGRDDGDQFPQLGTGGNFYLKVNGRDFLARGATYTPDLLYRDDPGRRGRNPALRQRPWAEHHSDGVQDPGRALRGAGRRAGHPLDGRLDVLQPVGEMAAVESRGPCGRPGQPALAGLDAALACVGLHLGQCQRRARRRRTFSTNTTRSCETCTGRTPLSTPFPRTPQTLRGGGSGMASRWPGPIPGGRRRTGSAGTIRRLAGRRPSRATTSTSRRLPVCANSFRRTSFGRSTTCGTYTPGPTRAMRRWPAPAPRSSSATDHLTGAEEFADKAQLAHYEATRAQFESFAALGWADHKMTIYWMLNSHWPSFFGNIFGYYLRPGGAYYGAKKGLRPLSVTFDSYATADHSKAKITDRQPIPDKATGLRARVRIYDLSGRVRDDRTSEPRRRIGRRRRGADPAPGGGRFTGVLRAHRTARPGRNVLADNVYWQSQQNDDAGDPHKDDAFALHQSSWADMTALNTMHRARLEVRRHQHGQDDGQHVDIALHNPTKELAFFERAELTADHDGDEILPIQYSDNYVTVYPGETVHIGGVVPKSGATAHWVRVGGYNSAPITVAIGERPWVRRPRRNPVASAPTAHRPAWRPERSPPGRRAPERPSEPVGNDGTTRTREGEGDG